MREKEKEGERERGREREAHGEDIGLEKRTMEVSGGDGIRTRRLFRFHDDGRRAEEFLMAGVSEKAPFSPPVSRH